MTIPSNTITQNQSNDSIPDATEDDLVFTVHRIIALSTVLRNGTFNYSETCKTPDSYYHDLNTLPPGQLSIVAGLLFDLLRAWVRPYRGLK